MLFKVTKTEFWYSGSRTEWEKYFICSSQSTLESILKDRYGFIGTEHGYDCDGVSLEIEKLNYEKL